ncbi:MAG: hypothetical protein ABI608_00150 [Rhizomicrobium sp.]
MLSTQLHGSLRCIAQAGVDAGRAWSIWPIKHHQATQNGPRHFTYRDRLRMKYQAAKEVFAYSRLIRDAPAVVIRHMGTEGLLANLLHVIEVLHRVRTGADVHVDWKLDGSELGFRYGAVGNDVWSGLFRPIGTSPRPGAFHANYAVDLALWGTGKDYLTGNTLKNQRVNYNRTIAKWIEISNKNVLSRTRDIEADLFKGRFCLGVHRRVGNAGVAKLQKDGRILSLGTLLTHCAELLRNSGDKDARIFLATDDADAVTAFKGVFGTRLIIQDNIKRTTASKQEVHRSDWRALSLTEAEDVLVDTVLLSRCNALVHASSSVSTMASLLNPDLTLIRIYETGGGHKGVI